MLDAGSFRIGGQGQDEDAPTAGLSEVERRSQGPVAQVGRDSDGVGGQRSVVGQVGLGVSSHGGTDIPALDVENGQGAQVAQGRQGLLEDRDPGAAVSLEECGLRLDGSHVSSDRVNGPQ